MSTKIYGPSGIKVTVLSIHDEGEYMMVQSDTSGKVFYAHKDQIEELVTVEASSDEDICRAPAGALQISD